MKYTKEDVENRKSDYVCIDCGIEFLTDKQKQKSGVSTFHKSECCLCGEEKSVTHIRVYNYLNQLTHLNNL